jgi:hypothetical protein
MRSEWSILEVSAEYERRGYRVRPRDLLDAVTAGLLVMPRRDRFRTAKESKYSTLMCNRRWIRESARVFCRAQYRHKWREQRDIMRLIRAGVPSARIFSRKGIDAAKLSYIKHHHSGRT